MAEARLYIVFKPLAFEEASHLPFDDKLEDFGQHREEPDGPEVSNGVTGYWSS